ncbi:MAG: CRISPR-associated protein Csx16 [Pseudomonadales bacterium]|jgi:CRISPR-associated protein Csx16|nr:CRISPR-associated protein Csx16 [Pseudomonadales bacterium]
MNTYFISRHRGAREWAERRQLKVDSWITHLDPAEVSEGDTVIGTLPVNLAAEICARGARYFNLSLDLPENLRGVELNAITLIECGARLEEFIIKRVSA